MSGADDRQVVLAQGIANVMEHFSKQDAQGAIQLLASEMAHWILENVGINGALEFAANVSAMAFIPALSGVNPGDAVNLELTHYGDTGLVFKIGDGGKEFGCD